jgi:hypothetical protein
VLRQAIVTDSKFNVHAAVLLADVLIGMAGCIPAQWLLFESIKKERFNMAKTRSYAPHAWNIPAQARAG